MVDARQLQVLLDIRAKNEAAGVFQKMDADLKAVGKTADNVSTRITSMSREARIDRMGESFGKMAKKINDTTDAAKQLENRLKQIGATEKEIQRATNAFGQASGISSTGGRSALGKFGSELKALPSVMIPGAGGIGTDAIGKISMLLGALPPVALGLSAALVVAGTALAIVVGRANELKAAASGELKARAEVIAFIQTATKEEIKAKLDEAQIKRSTNQAVLDDAKSVLDQTRRDIEAEHGLNELLKADAFAIYGEIGPKLQAAKDAFNDATKAASESAVAETLLTQAYEANFAASTAYIEKLKEEAKIKSDAAIAGASDVYQRELKKQQNALMTSAQLFGMVTAAIQEQNAAQAALNELKARKATGVTGVEIDKEITRLELQVSQAGKNIGDYYALIADKRPIEDAIQNEKDLAAARLKVDKINEDVNKAVADRTADLIKIQEKYKLSLEELKTSFERAGLEAEIERQQKLSDLANDLRDKEAEETTKYNEDRVKIEGDYQKRVKEIQREFTRSSAQAIQDRDAVALDAAERKRNEELEDAKTTRDEQLKEREIQYKAELRGLKNNHQQRINEINLAFQREAEQRARKYAYDQQALHDNNLREIAAKQSAFAAQLAELRKNLLANNAEWAAAGQAIVNYAKQVKNSINNILGGGNSGVANGAIPVTPGTPPDLGNIFGGGGSRSLSSGATGLRAPQSAGIGSGVSVAVNGVGMSKFQVIREVTKQLEVQLGLE